ncbi:MAG: sugar phosphate isomerase/epimerase [Ruminococcaceae bacterium]|nr:sugar phosphate isomerase/epimerase [Oscillospiraceae bacterium]
MKRLVGISLHDLQVRYGDMRALEIAHEIGADAVDFSTSGAPLHDDREKDSVYARSEDEIVSYYDGVRRRAQELGLLISQTHGRIRGFRKDEEENRAVARNARIDCLVAQTLGAPICVMHSVATGLVGPETSAEEMRDLNFEWFSTALRYGREYHVKIATETFGDSPKYKICDFFGQIDEFVNAYDRLAAVEDFASYLSACVDTGHSNKAMRFGNPTPADVIRRLGKRVGALHLNDNDTLTDQHKIPMTGCIDWNDVMDALDEIGYEGVYNMELNLTHFGKNFMIEEAAFAIKVMRQILKDRE